ncbi:MAG: hypothetical protein MUO26_06160 [Methanotrichaceae archaeon]|nr:hypothetical protein [Methanotrichaceae archaeon]
MPDSDNMSLKIQDMLLRMGDEQMFVELERTLTVLDERERKINETLEELLYQVDELSMRIDALDNTEIDDIDDLFPR